MDGVGSRRQIVNGERAVGTGSPSVAPGMPRRIGEGNGHVNHGQVAWGLSDSRHRIDISGQLHGDRGGAKTLHSERPGLINLIFRRGGDQVVRTVRHVGEGHYPRVTAVGRIIADCRATVDWHQRESDEEGLPVDRDFPHGDRPRPVVVELLNFAGEDIDAVLQTRDLLALGGDRLLQT